MKKGRLSDTVYNRSVRKKLKKLPETIFHGAAGDDCAMFALSGIEEKNKVRAAAVTCQVTYAGAHCGKYGVLGAINQAAVSGCSPVVLLLSLLLPEDAPESLLQQIAEQAGNTGEKYGVPVTEVSASVTGAVTMPVLTVTAIGPAGDALVKKQTQVPNDRMMDRGRAQAGMDVIMTKWAGLEGSVILANSCREKLLTRYPAYLVEDAAEFDRFLSIVPEIEVAKRFAVCAACAAAEGGIFRALWSLGVQADAGLEIQLKKIPIRQETVEICNHLDLNPYELMAGGSLLMIAPQGEALVQEMEKAGICAAVIGTVTDNHDRVIVNGEERRFLEPAKADEIFKIM